jgi:TonB-linked SusC/RagA family outer membrane protein
MQQFKQKKEQLLRLCLIMVSLFLFGTTSMAQQTVTGKIVSSEGDPLAGATVSVKGNTTSVVSTADGEFSILASKGDVLLITFTGYSPEEVTVRNTSPITVSLSRAATEMDKVVVVGYGTVKKRDLTGSVVSLNADDLDKGVQVSVDNMIKGRAPGVQVTSMNGEPGSGFVIRIRGANSINAGNDPLYVIDGFPISNSEAPGSSVANMPTSRNPLNALNPGDIESIEILKDASATAIYGSRGANGVVIITTKKGKGKLKVDYSGYLGSQQIARKLDLMNASQYMNWINSVSQAQGNQPIYTADDIKANAVGTDWQDEIFRKAPVSSNQISLSGSSEKTQYYISFDYLNQQGIIISSGSKQYIGRVNLTHTENKVKFGLNLNTSRIDDDYVPNGLDINAVAGVVASALQMDPIMKVRNDDGTYAENQNLDLDNPVAIANTIFDNGQTNRTFGNFYVEYSALDNLKLKLNYGNDRQTSRRDAYTTNDTKRGQRTNASASIAQQDRSNDLIELTLNYNKDFNEVHHLNALAGYTYQVFDGRRVNASTQNFPTNAYLTNNLGAGDKSTNIVGSGRSKHQLLSYLGRANYSFKDKYLLTASFRIDGSSRFGEQNKYGYFPSVAFAWKLGEEGFIKQLNTFSDLKFRASYGQTGNQDIGDYQSLVLLGVTGSAIFNEGQVVGISPVQLGNQNLKWETTKQFDAGLDFGFLNNRITGSLDYFVKNTFDLLLYLPIPLTSGFGTSLQNVGNTRNSGFEFLITSKNLVNQFKWSTTLNGSTIKNKVTSLGPVDEILQGGMRFIDQFTIIRPGDPINSYYGYKVAGIFQSAEEVTASAQQNAKPGDIKFVDINGDGSITPADRTILGNPFPDFSLGLSNNFSYKGLTLDVFLEGVLGNEMLNFTKIDSESPIEFRRNRMAYVLDRWTDDNHTNKNPSFNSNSGRPVNSRVVEDASYVRLRSVQLGYNFSRIPKFVRSLSIFASAQNLFTITNYTGYNPDVSSLGSSNLRVDYYSYPLSKIYTIGINLGL